MEKMFDKLSLESGAVVHPYLMALSKGDLPNMPNAIRDLLSHYRGFSQYFTQYLELIMSQMDIEDQQKLEENLQEELGFVDDEQELLAAGIDPSHVNGVRHVDLFLRFLKAIQAPMYEKDEEFLPQAICLRDTMFKLCRQSKSSGVAALAWGCEHIVPHMYAPIFDGILIAFPDMAPRDYVFFKLHVLCDEKHSQVLFELAHKYAQENYNTNVNEMKQSIENIFQARVALWDVLYERALAMKPQNADALYDAQSDNWVRREPCCLSDFTARPKIFDMCEPLEGLRVLDLGCGEGFCAREIKKRGAKTVIGIDISEKMVLAAQREDLKDQLGIQYFHGQVQQARDILKKNHASLEYDLIIAVFLFNYVQVDDMIEIMKQANDLLTPNGRFIFSIPHPSFPFWKRKHMTMTSSNGNQNEYPFVFDLTGKEDYFLAKNQLFSGRIWRKDGVELNVQLVHKPMEEYLKALSQTFDGEKGNASIPIIKELYADEKLQELLPEFVQNLRGIPLHIAFTIKKIDSSKKQLTNWHCNAWNKTPIVDKKKLSSILLQEFFKVYQDFKKQQITYENVEDKHLNGYKLFKDEMFSFGQRIKKKLIEKNSSTGNDDNGGFALIDGTSILELFQDQEDQDQAIRLFYYLLSKQLGEKVIEKRGRLHDVIDRSLDIHEEDVLFSVTNVESTYHTDSTDRACFPDIVGLLCKYQDMSPHAIASQEGDLFIVNACNVYGQLLGLVPVTLLEALQKPIPRDLIAKGMGNSNAKPQYLIENNTAPIFSEPTNPKASTCLTFRYMRFWIEKGFEKSNQQIPIELKQAMNMVDDLLEKNPSIPRLQLRLAPGEMIFVNNHFIAHNRSQYQDKPMQPKRHMIRTWIQC